MYDCVHGTKYENDHGCLLLKNLDTTKARTTAYQSSENLASAVYQHSYSERLSKLAIFACIKLQK